MFLYSCPLGLLSSDRKQITTKAGVMVRESCYFFNQDLIRRLNENQSVVLQ